MTSHLLKEIGRRSYITNKNSLVGLTFSKTRNSHDLVHSIVYDHSGLFDKNYSYKIEDYTQEGFKIVAELRPEAEILRIHHAPSASMGCLLRSGVTESFPKYIGLPFANTTHIQCIYRGDTRCVDQVSFQPKERPSLRLIS